MRWSLLAVCFLLAACKPPRINQSPEYFLSPDVGARLAALQEFPMAWWNYVVVDHPGPALCAALKAEPGLDRVACEMGPADLRGMLAPWLRDLPLRTAPPSMARLKDRMNLALAKAGAPIGSELAEILRADPLGSYEELMTLLLSLNPVSLAYRDGYLRMPGKDTAVIPMLLRFPRSETERIVALREKVASACGSGCGEPLFIGAHFGSEWNQRIVKADMARVSWIGSLLFALFLGALVFTGRWTALLVMIPVSIGVGTAGWAVGAWNGSIHGLTVAFGSSLTGIALDYAFHAFVRNSGVRVWRANLIGYLTTIAVFAVMAFSAIPLVREIMAFALIGVSVAVVLFYLGTRLLPESSQIEPFAVAPVPTQAAPWLLAASLATLVAAVFTLHPDFSLQNLEQSSPRQKAATRELFRAGKDLRPAFRVHSGATPESEFVREQDFARESGMRIVNRLTFLPTLAEQERNLAAWRKWICSPPWAALTDTQRRFFAPFLEQVSCEALQKLRPSAKSAYAATIQAEGNWLSTFFPSNPGQELAVAAAFPDSFSIRELVELFPARIQREMAWMCPLSLLLVAAIVWAAYRNWRVTFAIFIPWIVGAALASVGLWFSSAGFGFVSLVGMLMVFGIATDFGVFCANYYLNSQLTRQGIWTALLLAGLVSLLGFTPLLFAQHVVLRQLGEPLVLGAIGILIGTFFVQPWWMRHALAR